MQLGLAYLPTSMNAPEWYSCSRNRFVTIPVPQPGGLMNSNFFAGEVVNIWEGSGTSEPCEILLDPCSQEPQGYEFADMFSRTIHYSSPVCAHLLRHAWAFISNQPA